MHSTLLLFFLFGCQSEKSALEIVCNSPSTCKSCNPSNRDVYIVELAVHMDPKIKNKEVNEMFGEMAASEPLKKIEIFENALKKSGIEQCEWLPIYKEEMLREDD